MLTGVSASTKQNLQLGAGVLMTAYAPGSEIDASSIIGATRGGGSFVATPTIRQIEADGVPENVKELVANDGWTATLNTTLIEFKKENLLLALGPGAVATDVTANEKTTTTITCSNEVKDADFKDIYWVGDLADGSKIAIKLKNALNSGGLNLTITNKGEGTYALSLVAHYSVSDLKSAPFEIYR
jgi:hypothetical protein